MKLGMWRQHRGTPSLCPACWWNWAQPGPRPPNTFHRGRLLRAHMGMGRAAEPGTLRAWERAARKEPHGWQGSAGPQHGPVCLQPLLPSWHSPILTLCPNSTLSRHPGTHPHRDQGCPSLRCHQHMSRHMLAQPRSIRTIQMLAHTHTQAHGCLHTQMHADTVCTHRNRQTHHRDTPPTFSHLHKDTSTQRQPPSTQKHTHRTNMHFAQAHVAPTYQTFRHPHTDSCTLPLSSSPKSQRAMEARSSLAISSPAGQSRARTCCGEGDCPRVSHHVQLCPPSPGAPQTLTSCSPHRPLLAGPR